MVARPARGSRLAGLAVVPAPVAHLGVLGLALATAHGHLPAGRRCRGAALGIPAGSFTGSWMELGHLGRASEGQLPPPGWQGHQPVCRPAPQRSLVFGYIDLPQTPSSPSSPVDGSVAPTPRCIERWPGSLADTYHSATLRRPAATLRAMSCVAWRAALSFRTWSECCFEQLKFMLLSAAKVDAALST